MWGDISSHGIAESFFCQAATKRSGFLCNGREISEMRRLKFLGLFLRARDVCLRNNSHAGIVSIDYWYAPDFMLFHLRIACFQGVTGQARDHCFGEIRVHR